MGKDGNEKLESEDQSAQGTKAGIFADLRRAVQFGSRASEGEVISNDEAKASGCLKETVFFLIKRFIRGSG